MRILGFLVLISIPFIVAIEEDDIASKLQSLEKIVKQIQAEDSQLKRELGQIKNELKRVKESKQEERKEIPMEISNWNMTRENGSEASFKAGDDIGEVHNWKIYAKASADGQIGIFLRLLDTFDPDNHLAKKPIYAQLSAVVTDPENRIINRLFGQIINYNEPQKEIWSHWNSISEKNVGNSFKINFVLDFYGPLHTVYDQWEKTVEEKSISFEVTNWTLAKENEFRDSALVLYTGEDVNMPSEFLLYLRKCGDNLGVFFRLIKPYDPKARAILLDYTVHLVNSDGEKIETGIAGLRNYIKTPSWGFEKFIPLAYIEDPEKKIQSPDGTVEFILKTKFYSKSTPVYPMLPSPTEFVEVELVGENLLDLIEASPDPMGQGHIELDLGIGKNFTVPGLFWDEEDWMTEWNFKVYLLNKQFLLPKIEVDNSKSDNSQPIMAKFQVDIMDSAGETVDTYVPILEDFRFGKLTAPLNEDFTVDKLKELKLKYSSDFVRFRLRLTVYGRYSTYYKDLTL